MKTEKILQVLRIVAWVAFIGSAIAALIQIIAFVISFIAPDAALTITGTEMKLTELRKNHLTEYICVISFLLVLAGLHVQVWEKVKDLLTNINLKSPFTMEAALLLEKIGYFLISIWIVGTIADNYIQWLAKRIGQNISELDIDFNYLFIAGIVYIISQVFKRGVEIQTENELTV